MSRTTSISAILLATSIPLHWASAGVRHVEITMYMPCDGATAARAVESLEAVPGVPGASIRGLQVNVQTGPEFRSDPLLLPQMLWERKIYPNEIRLHATGTFESGPGGLAFTVADTGQRFRVLDIVGQSAAQPPRGGMLSALLQVTDWIEDVEVPPDHQYSVKVLEWIAVDGDE